MTEDHYTPLIELNAVNHIKDFPPRRNFGAQFNTALPIVESNNFWTYLCTDCMDVFQGCRKRIFRVVGSIVSTCFQILVSTRPTSITVKCIYSDEFPVSRIMEIMMSERSIVL